MFWRSHCQSLNRLVLRYISQGIQADTGEPDRLAAIEARLDVNRGEIGRTVQEIKVMLSY
jgi:hypothetical protein